MLTRLAKPWRRPDDVPALGRAGRYFILGNSVSAFGASLAMPYFAIFLLGIRGGAGSAVGVLAVISVVDLAAQRLVASPLERRWGSRLPAVVGCWIQSVGWVLLAVSSLPWHVFACAVAIGAGNALFFSVRVNLQLEIVDEAAHAYSFSLRYLCGNVGVLLGGVIGGVTVSWLGTHDGVRVLLLVNAATFALFAVILSTAVRTAVQPGPERTEPERKEKPQRRWNRAAAGLLVGYFSLVTAGLVQFEAVLPLQLTTHGGMPPAMAGYLFSAAALTTVTLQMPVSRLSTRLGGVASVRVLAAAWIVASALMWGGEHIPGDGRLAAIVLGVLMLAFGECLFFPAVPSLLKTDDLELRRQAGSLTASAHSLGQFAGPSIGILLVTHSSVGFYLLVVSGAVVAAVVTRGLRSAAEESAASDLTPVRP